MPRPHTLSETDAAYLAGMIDGEGSIMVSDRRKTRPNASRPSIKVTIHNTHYPLMQWLSEKTGTGTIHERKAEDMRGNVQARKNIYYWCVTSVTAVYVLQQVVSFLIEKKELAQRAIMSQGLISRDHDVPFRSHNGHAHTGVDLPG
jgi:hypothetical protein